MRSTCLLLCALFAGCTQERPSEIVQRVEAAGAGNVRVASRQSLEQWFRKRPDVGGEIRKLCAPVQAQADANWGDSTEGRVCQAAITAAVFQFTPRKGDGKAYQAGK